MNIAGMIGLRGLNRKVAPSEGELFLQGTRLGEARTVVPMVGQLAAAEEGSYFVTTNPTPATALAFAVNASFDATKSMFAVKNNAAAGGKNVILDRLKILPTTAAASATSAQFAIFLDNSQAKYTSGGTEYTPANVNLASDETSIAKVIAGSGGAVLTTVAQTRLVSRGVLRSVIPAVLEEMSIIFGGPAAGSSATAAGNSSVIAPPVIIPPQGICIINVWFPSNSSTGLSYEFELGHIER